MKIFCLGLFLSLCCCGAGWAGVLIKLPPIHLGETTTTTKSDTTVTGPAGTRKIHKDETANTAELPGSIEEESDAHTTVSGVNNPGIQLEHKTYYPNAQGSPQAELQSTGSSGSPGSIDVKTYKRTTIRPMYSH
jgi:hypothetical protein